MPTLLDTYFPAPPYDFDLTARAAARYYGPLGRYRDGVYTRALHAGDGLALVQLEARGTPAAPAIQARLVTARGDVDEAGLRVKVARMLNPHLALSPFYERARQSAPLWPLVDALHGLHVLGAETVFEALAVTIIEQQISLAAAQRYARWLVEWAGDCIEHGDETYYTFPSAARLATATVEDLIPLKITFQRMRAIIAAAQPDVVARLEALRHAPVDDSYAALMALPGVGHWTAAWTLTRGLGHMINVGSADVALRAAVNHYFYGETGRSERARTDAFFAQFDSFAGLACYYTLMKWAFDRYP